MSIQAITKASTTPGTPVKIYTPDGTHPVLSGNGICITADQANTGVVYIGTKGMVVGASQAARVKVLASLKAGEQWPSAGGFGGVDPDFLYLDVVTSGDGVSVAVAG